MGDRRFSWTAAATGLLFFVSLVGLGTVDSGGDGSTELVSSADTTTTMPGGSDATLLPGETTTTTAGAAGPSTTAGATATTGGSTATTGAPADPNAIPAVRPPADGKYRMKQTVKADDEEEESNLTATVTTLSKTASETRQKTDSETEGGDSDNPFGGGGGFQFAGESSWRADGVYLKPSGGNENMTISCNPPEQLALKLPLAKGVAWTNDFTCDVTFRTPQGEAKSKQHFTINSTVTGSETRQVAGKSFAVWVIESTTKNDGTTNFNGQQFANKSDSKGTEYFSPEIGLPVFSESTGTAEVMGQKTATKTTVQLQNHSPE